MARSKSVDRDIDKTVKQDMPYRVRLGGKVYPVTASPPVGYMLFMNQKKSDAIKAGRVNAEGDPLLTLADQLEIYSALLRIFMGDDDFEAWVLPQPMDIQGYRDVVSEIESLWLPKDAGSGDVDPKADISSQDG